MREQSRLMSFVEAVANTALGFVISVMVSVIVYPLCGVTITLTQNFTVTAVFTVVSVLRSYAVRRWFAGRFIHITGRA